MPWTPKQMKVIRAKKHGWNPPGEEPFEGVSEDKLGEMEKEPMRPPIKSKGMKAKHAAMALGKRKGMFPGGK